MAKTTTPKAPKAKKKYSKSDDEKAHEYESGLHDLDVQDALELISKNAVVHQKHELIWRTIQQLFESQFYVSNPEATKTISSKTLLQILWKVANKMKIPDFSIFRAGPFATYKDKMKMEAEEMKREWYQQVVTAAVATVMKEGGFVQCCTSKGGVFYKGALFGDSHIDIGFNEDKSAYPIAFRVSSLSDTYLNNDCTDLRDPVGGLSADGKVTFYRYTEKQFNNLWPEFEGKVCKGEIPKNSAWNKQLEKSWLQTSTGTDDLIEVAYAQFVDAREIVFAGKACTVLRKRIGIEGENDEKENEQHKMMPDGAEEGLEAQDIEEMDTYPYVMDGVPYLSMLHFMFFPSSEGYYNYGIGHMVFDIAVLAAKMDDMAYKHGGKNVNPINFVNSSSRSTTKLFKDILKARQDSELGGDAFVISGNSEGSSGVTVENFQSPPITGEWERMFTRLETQIRRMGFNLDGTELGANPNEMTIMANEESQDAPIKQIIEFNAIPFFQMAVDITMDFIRKFIPDDDMTPLNSTTDIEAGSVKIPMRSIPLGWVAKELRANKYFTVVNSRDGTIPSGVMQQARITQTMKTLTPGTPAWTKQALALAKLNGQNLTEEDMMPQQQAAPGAGPAGFGSITGGPTQVVPTETTPLNAYSLKHGQR